MVCDSRHYLERTENQHFNYCKHKQNSHKNTFFWQHIYQFLKIKSTYHLSILNDKYVWKSDLNV